MTTPKDFHKSIQVQFNRYNNKRPKRNTPEKTRNVAQYKMASMPTPPPIQSPDELQVDPPKEDDLEL